MTKSTPATSQGETLSVGTLGYISMNVQSSTFLKKFQGKKKKKKQPTTTRFHWQENGCMSNREYHVTVSD